jgi:hypothetical protein
MLFVFITSPTVSLKISVASIANVGKEAIVSQVASAQISACYSWRDASARPLHLNVYRTVCVTDKKEPAFLKSVSASTAKTQNCPAGVKIAKLRLAAKNWRESGNQPSKKQVWASSQESSFGRESLW